MTEAKINSDISIGLQLETLKVFSLPGLFLWKDSPVNILGVLFGPDPLLEINLS